MLCKAEDRNPEPCLKEGRLVARCTSPFDNELLTLQDKQNEGTLPEGL
jgi:hypothetical protein